MCHVFVLWTQPSANPSICGGLKLKLKKENSSRLGGQPWKYWKRVWREIKLLGKFSHRGAFQSACFISVHLEDFGCANCTSDDSHCVQSFRSGCSKTQEQHESCCVLQLDYWLWNVDSPPHELQSVVALNKFQSQCLGTLVVPFLFSRRWKRGRGRWKANQVVLLAT